MALQDDTTQTSKTQGASEEQEAASSPAPLYQHSFPFTIVPNCFIDDYIPRLSFTAQSVMLVFYRLTLGWHRAEIFISQKELRQRTGIASYATLNAALKELFAAGLITVSDQRGQRRLQGYCLTPAALSATDAVALHDAQQLHQAQHVPTASDDPLPSATASVVLHHAQPPHNVQFLHTAALHPTPSATVSVEGPLQKLEQYRYRNRSGTATESVVLTSSQPAQGMVPDKPKERERERNE